MEGFKRFFKFSNHGSRFHLDSPLSMSSFFEKTENRLTLVMSHMSSTWLAVLMNRIFVLIYSNLDNINI